MDIGSIIVIVINLLWMIPLGMYFVKMGQREAKSVQHRRRLLEQGRPAQAVVLSVDEQGPWHGKVPHLFFQLRASPAGEPPFETTARGFFRQFDFPRLQVGSTVEIRFDPADRSFVAVVGDRL